MLAQDKAEKIDQLVQRFHYNGQFDGAVLVAENGQILFKKGYGFANREWDIPNSPDTKFRIGSITKQITAMTVLILQEKGLLNVNDSLCNYIPDCPLAWKDITIHHLMTNTSGIPNFTNFSDNDQWELLPTTPEQTINRFIDKKLMFSPGTEFGYSSSGFVLLGYIIEQLTSESYEDAVMKYIFEPLNMQNSGYDHPKTILKYRASGYTGGRLPGNAPYFEMDTPHAAGALYSTVEDLFLWDQALYNTELVSKKSLEQMFSRHVELSEYWGYGYGWYIGQPYNRSVFSHMGSISGFRSQITRFPDEKVFIISLSNSESGATFKVNHSIAAILFNEEFEFPKKHIKDTLYQIVVKHDVETAVKCFNKLKDEQSNDYDFSKYQLNWLGVELRENEKLDEAVEVYNWIIDLYPDWFESYNGIADVYRCKGDRKKAIKYYAKSLEINPESEYAQGIAKVLEELTQKK